MAPEEFASICAECVSMGAALIGGCCGTTPDHIAALQV
jgi:methionine synthase I (cobalamin-dependent)